VSGIDKCRKGTGRNKRRAIEDIVTVRSWADDSRVRPQRLQRSTTRQSAFDLAVVVLLAIFYRLTSGLSAAIYQNVQVLTSCIALNISMHAFDA
jgi:hypothetical protein